MAYNPLHKLRDNIRAIKLAIGYKNGSPLSDAEVIELQKYSGFGGIKAVLYPYGATEAWLAKGATKDDLKLHADMMQLHELLKQNFSEPEYNNVIGSLRNSVLTAFYTPEIIPRTLYTVLNKIGIKPLRMYEPAAGSGVFIREAVNAFPSLEQVVAVEKDELTGLVLSVLNSTSGKDIKTHISGLEEAPTSDNGLYDLVVSNIPFGNFPVYDRAYPNKELSGKIHNYFFVKALDKLADGGIMAFVTTDGFLNSPSNLQARKYLFERADFIAMAVMPDNLMKDTGGTEAPSHLLIVQKRDGEKVLSETEQLLLETEQQANEKGSYYLNSYILKHGDVYCGDSIGSGENQYGKPYQRVWQNGEINDIGEHLDALLRDRMDLFFVRARYPKQIVSAAAETIRDEKPGLKLTYLPMPESKAQVTSLQLGLFDTAPAEQLGRASAYLNKPDESVIQKATARIISTIRTSDHSKHETVVMLAARQLKTNQYLYKLCSNAKEIDHLPASWMNGLLLGHELEALSKQLQEFDHTFLYEGDSTFKEQFQFSKQQETLFTDLKPFYRQGTLVVHDGKVGSLGMLDGSDTSLLFKPFPVQSSISFYEMYVTMRDNYLQLANDETAAGVIQELDRIELNGQYERFTTHYGPLNSSDNRKRILNDTAFGLAILSSLERREGEKFVKADVLTQSLRPEKEQFLTEDPAEALAHCLNDTGGVDMEFIAASLGVHEDEAIQRLGELVYLNPETDEWETADQYLSGNVVEKLAEAQRLFESFGDQQYERSAKALEKVQPEPIPFELLDFNLGERWIPVRYYEEFASHLFEEEIGIHYLSSVDSFKVAKAKGVKATREFRVDPKGGNTTYGHTLLEHALENTSPFYTYKVGVHRKPDTEATQLAHQKIEQIRTAFIDWLRELPAEEKERLTDTYNTIFNCYRLREYDGSHLTFPGLDKKALDIEDLYSSQKNAAWRIIQNRGALIDHEVGLGKTLTMIVAAQEMKRLSIIQKPMILALKSNIGQIKETYKNAYPNARILCPSESDFIPAKRLRLFHEIKNNHWDCIIITHDQFGKIAQSPEVQRDILQSELDNVERDLETVEKLGGEISKQMLRGLEIRKGNLAGKLKDVVSRIEEKKDEGLDFKAMGIDHVFVDEAHKFKNLTFTTRHGRVAGLGNTEGSQRALNMLFAVRTLQAHFNSDLCVTFLSGTPLSNSLTELYLIYKYLRPNEMRRQGIENFDGWAAVFARKTTDFEFSVTNEIVAKERFRHFIKVPELAMFYNEITDYKTAQHIRLDKPELEEILVDIEPTPEQRAFTIKLMEFARTGNGELIGRGKLSPEEDKGRMLLATNYAKKMAVDMRLISGRYSDHPGNKVNTAARNIAKIYHESTPHRGTQIVFSDIGTPKPDDFNVYDALKEKLVKDFNIPSHEITFIHDWTETTRRELFRRMNKGDIRILLGSTEKAGTGLNVQQRVVAMHHLDIPWKPSELEQRNGRGARQGNRIAKEHYDNKVKNYIYAVKQSLDNYKFNLLKNKQLFISQMKNHELSVRTIDEGAMDEKNGMNFSEYIAILSGDTSLLEKSKLEKKVAVMESLKVAHFREAIKNKKELETTLNTINKDTKVWKRIAEDEKTYKEHLRFEQDGTKANPVQLLSGKQPDNEALGNYLIKLADSWNSKLKSETTEKIGSLYGFDLYIERKKELYELKAEHKYSYANSFYVQRGDNGLRYTYNNGFLTRENPKLAARHFLNAIDRTVSIKEQYEKRIKEDQLVVAELEKLKDKPFAQEAELDKMKTELASLEREIAIKIQENQLKKDNTETEEEELVEIHEVEQKHETIIRPLPTATEIAMQAASKDMRRARRFRNM